MAAANRHGKKTILPYDTVYLSTKTQYVTIVCSAISHDWISLKYSKIENIHMIRRGAHTDMKCSLYLASKRLILAGNIKSRKWPYIGDSYGMLGVGMR